MSLDQAQAFLAKVREDQSLEQTIQAVQSEDKDSALAEVVRIAAENGFVFAAEDYERATQAQIEEQLAAREKEAAGQQESDASSLMDLDLGSDFEF